MIEFEFVVVVELFGEYIELVCDFICELGICGEEFGFIGLFEVVRLWSWYILNCVFLVLFLCLGLVGDIGSGVGLFGLVLVIV